MPSDLHVQVPSDHYFQEEYDDLTRFASSFHQIDLVKRLRPHSVLEIGVGSKTVATYLKQNGIAVSTATSMRN